MFAREIHKDTFSFIVLFSDEKYQKSFKRAFLPLKKHLPRARVSRASHAWRVRAAKGRAKAGGFALPATSYYHACEHISRKSRADSCTHCLHARWIMGGAGVDGVSTLTEVTISLLQREKVARFTAADEVLPCVYCQKNLFRYVRTQTRTQLQPRGSP